jgi:hypothetical protein
MSTNNITVTIHTPGFAACLAATRRLQWSLKKCLYSFDWRKVWPGDLVRLNPTLLRRVA